MDDSLQQSHMSIKASPRRESMISLKNQNSQVTNTGGIMEKEITPEAPAKKSQFMNKTSENSQVADENIGSV